MRGGERERWEEREKERKGERERGGGGGREGVRDGEKRGNVNQTTSDQTQSGCLVNAKTRQARKQTEYNKAASYGAE